MKASGRLHLIADLRDLQIVDRNEENCGIVDDVELKGAPGRPLAVEAILVGPGAYHPRLPRWMAWLVRRIAGDGLVRIPWKEVESISSVVRLKKSAAELGLGGADRQLERLLPGFGAVDATR